MGAREKLNQAYLNGAIVVAAIVGLVAQSWTLFWIAVAYVIASSIYGGGIRPKPGRQRHRRS
jgi:hypothetical protein